MKNKITNFLALACIMAVAMLVSCSDKPGNPTPPDPQPEDTVYSIKLFADADMTDEIGSSLNFSTESTTMTVYVKASRSAWSATLSDDNASWMTIDPKSGAKGTTEVVITVSANDVENIRTNTITFTLDDKKEIKAELTINQEPMPSYVSSRLTDSLALVAIYNAFDGEQTLETNWVLGQPINTWDSIFCENIDGELRVVEIRFGFNKAKGNIPAEMGNLRKLRRLWISAQRIKGALPDGLGYAADLEEIVLKNAPGITALPSDMSGMKSLRVINISQSSVTSIPSSISKCLTLEHVEISDVIEKAGLITGDANELFTNLTALRKLILGDSEMTGDLSFCANKEFLNEVNFKSHKLAGEVDFKRDFVGCDSMDVLYLGSSPELTGKFDGILAISSVLRAVEVSDSQIGGKIVDMGYELGGRRYGSVWLVNNNIEGELPSDLFGSNVLNLSMNKLSGVIPQNIVDNIVGYFYYSDRICPQKEGYGFTNCTFPSGVVAM